MADPGAPAIISAEHLRDLYEEYGADLRVLEVHWSLDGSLGRSTYEAGHLPGAVYVDLEQALTAAAGPDRGRHPLPDPEAFAQAMRRAGISRGDRVVVADSRDGSQAARLAWMLRAQGVAASLLSGGHTVWQSLGGQLEHTDPTVPPGDFTAAPWPKERLADIEETARLAATDEGVVLDARAAERYRGETEPIDPRAGHIPGAVSAPYTENLMPSSRFQPAEELRARYAKLGVRPYGPTVVYCGSGVTAAHDLLALEQAGFAGVRLFPGSWSQWSADAQRDIATGAQPGEPAPRTSGAA